MALVPPNRFTGISYSYVLPDGRTVTPWLGWEVATPGEDPREVLSATDLAALGVRVLDYTGHDVELADDDEPFVEG